MHDTLASPLLLSLSLSLSLSRRAQSWGSIRDASNHTIPSVCLDYYNKIRIDYARFVLDAVINMWAVRINFALLNEIN
ncbi:hypothetical protein [Sulfuricurvum sp.]|uniref:hypothetical protein n=1 Tax=Sulfuricurvum sp. TaxID=2025608 RepID=UPI00260DECD3|nr:hypothetical protein [Sulfuricurvum sp.]MDD4949182.1 hypothetical protein [Sulfuricurvum sp.]